MRFHYVVSSFPVGKAPNSSEIGWTSHIYIALRFYAVFITGETQLKVTGPQLLFIGLLVGSSWFALGGGGGTVESQQGIEMDGILI